MTEIELITQQIEVIREVITNDKILILISIFVATICTIIGFVYTFGYGSRLKLFGVIMLMIGIGAYIILGIAIYEYNLKITNIEDLEKQRSDLIKSEIKTLSCEGLRQDILEKLEDDNMDYYLKEHDEFEKDYYYMKCEIPLREEVMKLRGID